METCLDMKLGSDISGWLLDYLMKHSLDCFVVGVSGGIDSAVTSTLAAKTGKPVYVLNMEIHQSFSEVGLGIAHINWLCEKFENVYALKFNLTEVFDLFADQFSDDLKTELSLASSRSRLRMMTLYQIASSKNGLVVGTGNKVEDFGVGFYTKYGDGGVDISPIADCTKSQVWEMGKNLGILKEIIDVQPTDGLWDDGRTDVNQLGMSYQELEEAMMDSSNKNHKKYLEIRKRNLHKMNSIPVCKMKDD